ncbi:tRNA pseudouridine(13) synthase TruD [Stygiolobus caldivivus]|uniref:tRNA pseudouridine synthase D n=1 Tax=Stygiolobus caldivivus TaxID=2824673 RepID=A0A8D5U702_9CREN|nr:tRNA pseudouridine(13) synthase TruD [Stygiolobus caldivivus]BCU70474.1 tRNA pseudouridine synthase D [Stygiolobus caldivivus]
MEKYYINENWEPISVTIPRPYGFKVVEEISNKPVSEWKGKDKGRYAVYLLRKVGIDHFTVIDKISTICKMKPSYIGIKDTNAVTEQIIYFTSKPEINEYRNDKFELIFLGFSDEKFNHTGNMFEIELVSDNNRELERRLSVMSNTKYLFAYIGYQRFGTIRPNTHIVGKYLLLRDWCESIRWLAGRPFESENDKVKEARLAYEKGDYEKAIQLFPKKFRDEREVIKALAKGEDCLSALKKVKTPLRFFVEAYQSYLFNKYLSLVADNLRGRESDDVFLTIPKKFTEPLDPIIRQIAIEEGILGYSFHIPEIKVNLKDLRRRAFMRLRNVRVETKSETKKISFSLDRGMYATLVIREISRADPRSFT